MLPAQHCECTERYTLKWIILSSMNFNSIETIYPNIYRSKHVSARSVKKVVYGCCLSTCLKRTMTVP